jgi:hypothetical protein
MIHESGSTRDVRPARSDRPSPVRSACILPG